MSDMFLRILLPLAHVQRKQLRNQSRCGFNFSHDILPITKETRGTPTPIVNNNIYLSSKVELIPLYCVIIFKVNKIAPLESKKFIILITRALLFLKTKLNKSKSRESYL